MTRLDPPAHLDEERRAIWAETVARLTVSGRVFRADPEHGILELQPKAVLTCDISARSGPRRLLERHPVPDSAIPIPPGVRAIPLGGKYARGRVAWVSEHRYEYVMTLRWYCWEEHRNGRRIRGPYPQARDPATGRLTYMHTFIAGRKYIDHRNRDGLDCTDSNLRDATVPQNAANSGSRLGTSRYKGVSWNDRDGRWQMRIGHNGRLRTGYFPGTPEGEIASARAYDSAATELHGEFAWLNRDHFPELRGAA